MLKRGTLLGPYEIAEAIGAGGMGEVYKARDTRLDRSVAIKILPTHLSERSQARERFEREARAISSLNHPHICTLHDIGEQDGIRFIVMEHLEGESLAGRLRRGPLPMDEALKYAIEIADALEKAHRHGVTHRDLKPGNIMLTKNGTKLLDFGLAKFNPGKAATDPTADITAEGTIVGTLHYMSPEQLEGLETDARSDIFSFGAVLYEMVTGKKAFDGRSQSSVIAAIVHVDPPGLAAVQPFTPPALERVVQICLKKLPDARWQTAHDLGLQLQWIAEGGSQAGVAAPVAARRRSRESLAWLIAALSVLAVLALGLQLWRTLRRPIERDRVRFDVPAYASDVVGQFQISISPDGRTLAYVESRPDGQNVLMVRRLDSTSARELPGTEGASQPFWSPDNSHIGFFDFADHFKLKKVDLAGGVPVTLCETPGTAIAVRGSWNSDGVILVNGDTGIYRVPDAGGIPSPVTTLDRDRQETSHYWPYFLPDEKHFLYYAWSGAKPENRAIYVASLDSKDTKRLIAAESMPAYAPPGLLLLQRDGTLYAQPFDVNSLSLSGEAKRVEEDVAFNPQTGRAAFAVSANGVLIVRNGHPTERPLSWVGRDGKQQGTVAERGLYGELQFSPDHKQVAYSKSEGTNSDIWIMDLARGTATRLTTDPAVDDNPIWSADGKQIAFSSNRAGANNIYLKDVGGTGVEKLLLQTPDTSYPWAWSPDGRSLIYSVRNSTPQRAFAWMVSLTGNEKPSQLSQASSLYGRLSPDGHWMAYGSFDSGSPEVWVQPFPPSGSKWQISKGGGQNVKWRADGKELFFINVGYPTIVSSVDVLHSESGKAFEIGTPHRLFQASMDSYDVSADGQRFLIVGNAADSQIPITVLLNWTTGIFDK